MRKEGGTLRTRRAQGLAFALVVCFVLVALSQARLQILDAGEILARAKGSSHLVSKRAEPARRGPILAKDGQPLAEDLPLSRLTLSFNNLPKAPGFYADLAAASGVPEAQLEAAAQTGKSLEWDLPLSDEQAGELANVRARWMADGLGIERQFGRRYPLGAMAAGLVGRLRDGMAPDGLEGDYDRTLKGSDGVRVGMTDRTGGFLPNKIAPESRPATNGAIVETTIDSELQMAASQAIRAAVESHKADHGAAVVMDPTTGDVLAAANWPSFDPQPQPGTEPLPNSSDLDLCFMGRIEPGSMMKVLTLAKAIDTFGLPPSITCQGQIEVAGHLIRCDGHAGARAHGFIDPAGAIARSCNVSAATWGMRIGVPAFYDYLSKLGLLDRPGLGLRGEVLGFALKNPPAPRLEAANWGFGQSVTSTPLALADALSALGNGGVRMKLRLVRAVGARNYGPVPAGRMVSEQAADTVLKYMEGVFTDAHGTGRDLAIPGVSMAGKTGTAQIANKGGQYVSNFVGFMPAAKPKLMILVMIERPRVGGYYGAAVAGPAYDAIARAAIRRFGLDSSSAAKAGE
jgi:cell division protein FtsI/penicillin-binding protein 2